MFFESMPPTLLCARYRDQSNWFDPDAYTSPKPELTIEYFNENAQKDK